MTLFPSPYCAEQTRRHDPDRFYCGLFVPSERRGAYYALTAFYQEIARIPEIISEPVLGEIRLQWWRDAVEALFSGTPPRHKIIAELDSVRSHFGLERAPFERMLEARQLDLAPSPPRGEAALLAYADGTAGALTRLLLAVLAGEGATAGLAEAGRHAARATALAGLIRALPFHASARRLYLPQDLLAREGITPNDIFSMRSSPGLCVVVSDVAKVAGQHLEQSRALCSHVPRDALPAFFPVAIAEKILNRLSECAFDPFHKGMILQNPGRLKILLNAILMRY